ncbi:MAG TPA: hypothetical protein PK033_05335 [Acetivibrio sp.]|jgi:hypothetical protein|nr:hypothetical protein [Clostridium sp.]HOQ36101.1 hypothetical protein [Acetivibrio sp.]HPT90164.1 hypothetical protein [Acetivibrio sp.]HQA57285.1 hypothetical protein [Acetivibrio sp.]
MKYKIIIKAALELKNLGLLAMIVGIFALTGSLPFLFIGAAGYVYFLMETMKDEKFLKRFNEEQQIEDIHDLNEKCNALYMSLVRKLPGGMRERIKNIYNEKQVLVSYFSQDNSDPLRQKIVDQAINLVIAYFKLLYHYSLRIKQLNSINVNKVIERINNNKRKIEFLNNSAAISNIEKAVELDEKLVEKINKEKSELEMISSRLDYIESAILMFKHQIMSNEDLDPDIKEIDTVVNEAIALDNVLSKKNEKLIL